MKFTKLIMLASVVSLACACEKEMPAETVPGAGSGRKKRAFRRKCYRSLRSKKWGSKSTNWELWMKWP